MASLEHGAAELEAIGRRFKAMSGTPFRKELLRGIRETNKSTIAEVRANARATLPARGGLAALVAASKIGTRTRLSGASAEVQIKGTGKLNISDLNRGRLRHPVFGDRSTWVEQTVPGGWFDNPINQEPPRIRSGIGGALADVARKIEG